MTFNDNAQEIFVFAKTAAHLDRIVNTRGIVDAKLIKHHARAGRRNVRPLVAHTQEAEGAIGLQTNAKWPKAFRLARSNRVDELRLLVAGAQEEKSARGGGDQENVAYAAAVERRGGALISSLCVERLQFASMIVASVAFDSLACV